MLRDLHATYSDVRKGEPEDGEEPLLALVRDRLVDAAVPDEVASLILAAYDGDQTLRSVLAGEDSDPLAPAEGPPARRDLIYLESIAVAGFRGVGPKATLHLKPYAGLTLVVGRNGSGKSTFAEAAELALTGDSARWADRNVVFRNGWRNLHQGSPCEIGIRARVDGARTAIEVRRVWNDDHVDPDEATISFTAGGARYRSTSELGWRHPLEAYRPFLTANDLGRLVSATPSGLHDALAPILGIDPVVDADKRLMAVRKELDDRIRAVKTARDQLHAAVSTVDDERAHAAAAILAKRQPDLDALDRILSHAHDETENPVATACRRLTTAPVTDPDQVDAAASALRAAAEAVNAHATIDTGSADRIAGLLHQAVEHHDATGDGLCPVCGTGRLDAHWHDRAVAELQQLRDATRAARRAQRALDEARRTGATALSTNAAGLLTDLDTAAPALGEAAGELREALATWTGIRVDLPPLDLADRLTRDFPRLHAAVQNVRATAAQWLRERHDAWQEHEAALRTWLPRAHAARADETAIARVKKAREHLRQLTDDLRTARLAPFAAQSQQIWERLRQESNVELSGMRLDGTSTRRRVAFPATVDGTATSAMAVMSQGELQALGLAVFLPRACAEASPFRFLILDDPVQSMDPSKVDGLVSVLADLATARQVIVFTHDNRLPEAVRRLRVDAVIWEVNRRDQSVVEIRKNGDPVSRYLVDADSLSKATELPDNARYPLVSGFCRSAIEAACHEHIRRERIQRGERHADVEALIEQALTLTQVTALALFGDMHRGGDVFKWMNQRGRWAGDTFRACKEGVHGARTVNLATLVADTHRLTEVLR